MALLGDIIDRGTNAARPAAGTEGRLYYQTDGTAGLYRDSGSAWEYCDPAAGSVATDAIWDAAGDLAVGSGANTAVRLAMGTALQQLRVNAGATGLEWAAPSGGGGSTALSLARYTTAAGQSISNATTTIVNFGTSAWDTRALVTTGASWHFTADRAMHVEVHAFILFASDAWNTNTPIELSAYKNGVQHGIMGRRDGMVNGTYNAEVQGSIQVALANTDTLDVRIYQGSAATRTLYTDAKYCYVEITEIAEAVPA